MIRSRTNTMEKMWIAGGWYGRTCRGQCRPMAARTSSASSRSSQGSQTQMPQKFLCLRMVNGQSQDACWESVGMAQAFPWLGECMTLNTGESPNVVKDCRLSEILEDCVPQKYYLSSKACLGILHRAERRGKQLPPELEMALRLQSGEIFNISQDGASEE